MAARFASKILQYCRTRSYPLLPTPTTVSIIPHGPSLADWQSIFYLSKTHHAQPAHLLRSYSLLPASAQSDAPCNAPLLPVAGIRAAL